MSGIGKFLFGAAVTGAAAYGVYSFLQKYRVEIKPVDEDVDVDEDTVEADFEEKDEDEAESGEETTEESSESSEKTFDPGKIFNSKKVTEAADSIKDAANRAYTTIQHGSQQAADVVRDTVIPKGSEVVDKVSDAVKDTVIPKGAEVADKVTDVVKETVIPKGQEVIDRVKDVISGKAEEAKRSYTSTEIPIQGPDDEEKPEESKAAEGTEKNGAEASAAAESSEEGQTESGAEKTAEAAPESSVKENAGIEADAPEHTGSPDSPREGTVEFFDDEE